MHKLRTAIGMNFTTELIVKIASMFFQDAHNVKLMQTVKMFQDLLLATGAYPINKV